MKKLILGVAISATALLASPATVEAGCCPKAKQCCCKKTTACQSSCCQPTCCTPGKVEVCRRYYYKNKCVRGCTRTIRYVEVTYRKTKCGKGSRTWKKTYRV